MSEKKITVQDLGKMTMKEVHDLCERKTGCEECPFLGLYTNNCIIAGFAPIGWPIWEDDE